MMSKGPRFEALVQDAKTRIREISPTEAAALQKEGAVLLDVREKEEFEKVHATGAISLSKGIIELKIEQHIDDVNTPIICYCGGGSRSALAADNLNKMGYRNVYSVAGGFKAWQEQRLPAES